MLRLSLISTVLLAGCAAPAADGEPGPVASPAATLAPPDPAGDWPAFVSSFLEGYFEAHPSFAVMQGRHEHDGKLPDWSAAGIAREIDRLEAERERAVAFDGLEGPDALERDLIVSRIDRDLFWTKTARWPFRNPFFYFDWMLDNLDPNVYVSRDYAPPEQRLRAYISYARAVPAAADQIRANLETPLPRTYIDFGVAGFAGLASYYESDVPRAFAGVKDEGLQQDLAAANAGAIEAMKGLAAWLEDQREDATEDYALGPQLFRQMVARTEGLDVSLDALEAAGRADLERNLQALKQACAELVPGKSVERCIARVQERKPRGGAVEGARTQLGELRAFLDDRQLLTIPGTEEAQVREAPPYMRQNFAYIDIPGPYETGLPSTYYISPPDPAWSRKERDAYLPGEADLLFTSVHEVWPGHFLQFLHANRVKSRAARVFVGYAYSEGWAHYSEEMMCEAGLCEGKPEVKVGQLLNALLRNVRFLSAIGLHARGMTVAESEKMFREQGHQDAGNARQQAARGTYDAAYLNYNLGKLMIRKLRADWTATRGGRDAWRAFHDAFLSYGGPPVPLVRADMLGERAGSPL